VRGEDEDRWWGFILEQRVSAVRILVGILAANSNYKELHGTCISPGSPKICCSMHLYIYDG
jgi:hypothetical protein